MEKNVKVFPIAATWAGNGHLIHDLMMGWLDNLMV